MPVVSNSSPLISLARIGQLAILEGLFGQIVIPVAVYAEVVLVDQHRPGAAVVANVPWIVRKPVRDAKLVAQLGRELNQGEAEAIALAIAERAELLLLDERRARAVARRFALEVTGVVGVLLEAKQRNLIPAIKPLLDTLLSSSAYRLGPRLYREALRRASE